MNPEKKTDKRHVIILVVVILVFLVAAISGLKKINARLSKAEAMPSPPLAVKVVQVATGYAVRTIPALATVKSAATVQIKSDTGGTVLKLNFREGDMVKAGQKLAVIDSREQDAQLQASVARKDSAGNQVSAMHASLAALTSQLDSSQINLKYWQNEFTRGEKLFQARALTKSALDNMRNRMAEAEGKLASLKAQIQAQQSQIHALQSQQKAAEKDMQLWKVRRDYAEVVAPLDCIISARLQEEGNRVMPGTSIYNVEDVSSTRLIMQIPQESATMIRPGQEILWQDGKNSGFTVSRIFPVQNELRQVTIEAETAGKAEDLVFDMILPVRIVVTRAQGLLIPQEARFVDFKDSGRFYVFAITGSVAQRVSLTPILNADDGLTIINVDTITPGTSLAVGPYLENVRLGASFTVEVVK